MCVIINDSIGGIRVEILLICLIIVLIAVVTVFGILILNQKTSSLKETEQRINDSTRDLAVLFRDTVSGNQKSIGEMQSSRLKEMDTALKNMYNIMDDRFNKLSKNMGEIHGLAMGVDDLKKVLTNVKTRGILGEIQLGSIIDQVLSPEQYETNVATVPKSRNTVEFAIKLPGKDGHPVYIPVDSKFPLNVYSAIEDAYESNDQSAIEYASKEFVSRLKSFAKDINTKYIMPPYTTDFGIMFLPVEGMYLEAVKRGMVQILQHDYKICIAGPSTFAAMLNALQMGFRTVAIEKKSAQVWEILSDVKEEFDKFASVLDSAQTRINQVNSELDKLVGVRTRAIQKKLRMIEKEE